MDLIGQNRGQIVLEYVLLMIIAISAALLITNGLVGRDQDSPGIVIAKWAQMTQVIGQDKGD